MFTGLVASVGTVKSRETRGALVRIVVDLGSVGASARPGDSVAVNGVCLTVVAESDGGHAFECVGQTVALTTLGELVAGSRVNLEAALRLGDPLGGHIVQGHVDSVGVVASVTRGSGSHRIRIERARGERWALVLQGSITVDGISLTIADCGDGWFEVAIIPETLTRTTAGNLIPGARVNIEQDAIARLVDAAVARHLAVTRDASSRHTTA